MFKSKKGEIIQTEKSNKQTDSGKKGKTKSATKRPLLSKFFKNTAKDETKKSKDLEDKEDTLQSENTTEKLDVSEKENIAIRTQTQLESSVEVSPTHQVENEVVTHEITRTYSESTSNRLTDSSNKYDKYATLPRKTSGNDEAGKGTLRNRKSSEETRARKSSAGKKSPKSPGRKNKKGYPEISDAELVFTTANYSSQESANHSCDSTDDTNSPLFSRKTNGREISAFKQYSSSVSTSDSSDLSIDSPSLLTPEPLARCDVKSEDMSALIEMLRDLTDSFGAPPAQDSSSNLQASASYQVSAPSTTPSERENEFRLAWQDEAKELSERLLKKIQEIEITSSKENINRQQGEQQEEIVTVSNVAEVECANEITVANVPEVECSNEIDAANESKNLPTEAKDIKINENDTEHVDVDVKETKSREISRAPKTPGGVFIFGNKFHSSRHKFEKLEKTVVTEVSGKEKHVTKTTITKESCEGEGDDHPHGSTEVRVEEILIQQPTITITQEEVAPESSANDDSLQLGEKHIIQEKHVVTLNSSHQNNEITKDIDPTIKIVESTIQLKEEEPGDSAVIDHAGNFTEVESGSTETYDVRGDKIVEDETKMRQEKLKENIDIASELVDEMVSSIAVKEITPDKKQGNNIQDDDTKRSIRTSVQFELESSPHEEQETVLRKEKDGTVVIADIPLKKVEDFSQGISESIIKETLSEPRLISPCRTDSEEQNDETESPVSEGRIVSDEVTYTVEGENVPMDDLMLKYKAYIEESDTSEITDVLGNIKIEIKDRRSSENVIHKEDSKEKTEKHIPLGDTNISFVENREPLVEIGTKPLGVGSVHEFDNNVLMAQNDENQGEEKNIDVYMKHVDNENGHVDQICITETAISTTEIDGVTTTTKTITQSHKTKYRFDGEEEIVNPGRIIDIETMKGIHEHGDVTANPTPITITREEIDEDRKDMGSPRDMFSFQTDYEGVEVEPKITVEVEKTVCTHPDIEVNLLVEQSDCLSKISEESLPGSNIAEDVPVTGHLHGDTTVMININKTKDQIIEDGGFDKSDIDIQVRRTNGGCTAECNPAQSDTNEKKTQLKEDIKANSKAEIKQLISDIKAENVNIYAPEHSSCTDQCQASSKQVCERSRRDELIKQLLVKMSKARKITNERRGEIKTLAQQKSFDADFIVSMLNSRPGSTVSEEHIEVNEEIEPATRVSELAGIILKQYRSQYETIQLEIVDPESPDLCVIVKEVKSYHPGSEAITTDEQVRAEKSIDGENTQIVLREKDNIKAEVSVNLPQGDVIDGNICGGEQVEEPLYVNIVANNDSDLEMRPESVDDTNEFGESETVVTIIDHVVHESSTGIFQSDNDEPNIDEDVIIPITKDDGIIEKSVTDDVESMEKIISPTQVMDVEVEKNIALNYEDEEIPVEANAIAIEKSVDDTSISIETDKESPESIGSTKGEREVELEPTKVSFSANISSKEEPIDTETSEPITSTSHRDENIIQNNVIIADVIPAVLDDVVVVTRTEDVNAVIPDDQETSKESNVYDENVSILAEVPVIAPIVKISEETHEEKVVVITDQPNEVKKEEIRVVADISQPQIINDRLEEAGLTAENSESKTIEVQMEQTVITEQVTMKNSLVPTEVRSNLTSSRIIDEDEHANVVSQEEFDAFGNVDGQPCDMITIFKALRGHVASNEGTPGKGIEELPKISEETEGEPNVTQAITTPVKKDDVNEEVITKVEVSKSETEISEIRNPFPEEEPKVEVQLSANALKSDVKVKIVSQEETKDIETDRSSDSDSHKTSTEILNSQNGNGKLKKRPSASFRKISDEADDTSLTDKIRKSIESDTTPKEEINDRSGMIVCEEVSIVANIPDQESSPEINLESLDEDARRIICENDIEELKLDKAIYVPPLSEPVDEEGKAVITEDDIMMLTSDSILADKSSPETIGNETETVGFDEKTRENIEDVKEKREDEEKEEEKPLYIVCKDVNQTNIITSSRARIRDDDDSNSRTSSPSTPMRHSPIVRLTSTPPQNDVPSTTTNITNSENNESETTTNKESNDVRSNAQHHEIQSTTSNITSDDTGDFKIVTHEKRVMVQAQFFYEQNGTSLQGTVNGTVQRSCYEDQNIGKCRTHDMKDTKTVGVSTEDLIAGIPETMLEIEAPILSEKAPISDDIIIPQHTEDRIEDRDVKWNDSFTQTLKTEQRIGGVTANNFNSVHYLDTPVEQNKTLACEEKVDLLIDKGRLVEQPDDQMYRERHVVIIPEQTVTLTSRQVPKYQNIYIEMRSRGEVPIEADIDPYLSEIHFKDIESKWHNQGLLSPTYTSFQQVYVNNSPKPIVTEAVANSSAAGVLSSEPSLDQKTNINDTSNRSSPEVTFNKDVHESLQIFCDGLLTGLFKGNEGGDEIPQQDTETTIKINTDLKPIKDMIKEKSSETPSCRVFKCDEVMLRHELQESLQDGKSTTE